MVDLFISTKKDKFDYVLGKIRKKKYVVATANRTLNEIFLNFNNLKPCSKEFKTIKEQIVKMRGVETIAVVKGHIKAKNATMNEAISTNHCRLIFDIDSTLTRGGAGTIHPSIPPILQDIEDRGIWVYAATGRSVYDLIQIVNANPIQMTSIAENGGIILGFSSEGYIEHGSKTEPNKVLDHLQKKYKIKEDMKQGERITEVIFLQKDVSEDQLNEAIEAKKARVTIHHSQNSYHISAKDIDKGSAVLELGKRLKWGNAYKIAVGDSQMDVAMFNACDYSFAPKNGDDFAKEACVEILNGNYEQAIANLYDLIIKSH